MNVIPEQERDPLVDRYVNGQLSAEQEAEFEIRMMDDARLFEEVQMVEALKAGLAGHADLLLQQADKENTGEVLPFSRWLRQPLSLVASLLVAALLMRVLQTTLAPPVPDIIAINGVILLEASRGAAHLTVVAAPPYLLQIDAGLGNQAESFSVTLVDAMGNIVFEQHEVHADADGWVRVVTATALVGQFTVSLSWENGTQSKSFEVTLAGQ